MKIRIDYLKIAMFIVQLNEKSNDFAEVKRLNK